jgi:O-antigen/teichoic acid export membrane protein
MFGRGDRISYLSSGESAGLDGNGEAGRCAPPDGHFTPGRAGGADSALAEPAIEVWGRRRYAGFAASGDFPATLELPAIDFDSEPRPGRGLSKGSGNPLYRTAWALIVNTGGTTVLGFGYWVAVAHLYDRQTLGRSSALVSALILLSTLTQLNLSSALPRFLPNAGRSAGRLIAYSYGVSSLVALPVAAAFVLVMPRLFPQWHFLSHSRALEVLFILAAVVWGIFALEDAALTGLRRAEVVPVENLIYGVMKLVMVVCVATLIPASGIFASWAVPLLVIIPIINLLIFRRYVKEGDQAAAGFRMRQVARFASVDYVAAMSTQAYAAVLPLMVLSVLGAAANGSFYIAWTISFGLSLVATSFGISLMVEAAAAPQRLPELTRGIIARCALVTLLGAVVLIAAARPILHIYGAAYAAHAVGLLGLLAVGAIPRAAVIITWSIDRVAGKVGRAALTQAVLAILVLASSRYLLKYYGIDGIGYAWTAANLVIAIVRLPTLIKAARRTDGATPAHAPDNGNAPGANGLVPRSRGSHRKTKGGQHRTASSTPGAQTTVPRADDRA